MIKPSNSVTSAIGLAAITTLSMIAAVPALGQGSSGKRAAPATARPVAAPAAAPAQPVPVGTPAGAGDVTRTTFIQSMDAEFRKLDLDGDGKVTRAEVEQFERNAALAKAQAQNRALFASLDADQNGVLSPGEFAALVRNVPMPDVSAQMQRFDANRDQVITLVEYRTATLANFDRLDADKDGVVTERELAAGSGKPAPSTQLPAGR